MSSFLNVLRIPDLRRRIIFTIAVLALFRLGSLIPAPGVPVEGVNNYFGAHNGLFFGFLNLISGSGFSHLSLFALGVVPIINASIAFMFLPHFSPKLKQMQREESGQGRLTQYSRYLAMLFAAVESVGLTIALTASGVVSGWSSFLIPVTVTAGAAMLMWLGEQISKRGVGNGIGLLLMASILSSMPVMVASWWNGGSIERLMFPLVLIAVIVSIVFVQEGQRRIPITYARRTLGQKTFAPPSTYMPLQVNMAGVNPVWLSAIPLGWAISLMTAIPTTRGVAALLTFGGLPYVLLSSVLIFVSCYVYVAFQFNVDERADDLRAHGGYIPGIRPGRPTAQYLERIVSRLTLFGALFLAVIAALPTLLIHYGSFSEAMARGLGGTSLIIVAGVSLDTLRQVQSHMTMRSYEGFLK
jgi:preprotein translocase subunit SecY